jgi:hypothetical protein
VAVAVSNGGRDQQQLHLCNVCGQHSSWQQHAQCQRHEQQADQRGMPTTAKSAARSHHTLLRPPAAAQGYMHLAIVESCSMVCRLMLVCTHIYVR